MNRTSTLTIAVLAAATVAAPGAVAAPKTVSETYTATAPVPDPTNWAGGDYSVCAQNVPQSYHTHEVEVPAAGSLKVELTDYDLDWDLLLMDGKDQEVAASGSGGMGQPEVAQVKLKKAGVVKIVACNWAGGPTGEVTYTFTSK